MTNAVALRWSADNIACHGGRFDPLKRGEQASEKSPLSQRAWQLSPSAPQQRSSLCRSDSLFWAKTESGQERDVDESAMAIGLFCACRSFSRRINFFLRNHCRKDQAELLEKVHQIFHQMTSPSASEDDRLPSCSTFPCQLSEGKRRAEDVLSLLMRSLRFSCYISRQVSHSAKISKRFYLRQILSLDVHQKVTSLGQLIAQFAKQKVRGIQSTLETKKVLKKIPDVLAFRIRRTERFSQAAVRLPLYLNANALFYSTEVRKRTFVEFELVGCLFSQEEKGNGRVACIKAGQGWVCYNGKEVQSIRKSQCDETTVDLVMYEKMERKRLSSNLYEKKFTQRPRAAYHAYGRAHAPAPLQQAHGLRFLCDPRSLVSPHANDDRHGRRLGVDE